VSRTSPPDQLRVWARQEGDEGGVGGALPGELVELENRLLRLEVVITGQEQGLVNKVAACIPKEL
jgi:hypothetical protein